MGFLVTGGAMMMCTMGAAPATLNVLPLATTFAGPQAAGTIMENAPMLNIAPFGMCMSMSNPQVASATAAAMGVLTPMPCMPNVPGPWAPGSPTVMVGGNPALNDASMATCAFGGSISITVPGQFTVQVP